MYTIVYIFLQIRLQRQALEWRGGYKFWSCADVDIVNPVENKQKLCQNGEFDDSMGWYKHIYETLILFFSLFFKDF